MKIFYSVNEMDKFPNPVLTIGNYDGIHIGHRQIIKKVFDLAKKINGTSMLMTFEPHPLSILKPEKLIGRITPFHVKKRIIEENGIEVMIVVNFNDELRQMTPEDFFNKILLDKIGIQALIVGYDFKFGKGGAGNIHTLKTLCESAGIYFESVDAITFEGDKVGSNRIRKLLIEGNVYRASRLLGNWYSIEGRVIKGEGRGNKLGFPTINIETGYEIIPKEGVYITEVELDGKIYPSVTNIGFNPTFEGKRLSIETHIIDFTGDIYGKDVILYFHERIRTEIKFNDVEELKRQIQTDVNSAKLYFKEQGIII
ncbi:MAG TPA: bifunctional riboflavin kinase/FAD synthetase [Syntrophorhabdaceae bacterium]|nr:bifunctional riboflavin kinase/FAD synthetase [Syntrophorhabdaceae bacterium]